MSKVCNTEFSIFINNLKNYTNNKEDKYSLLRFIYSNLLKKADKEFLIFDTYNTNNTQEYIMLGGGKCKLCGSPGTTQASCPLNSVAVLNNKTKPEKHPLAKQPTPTPQPTPQPTPEPTPVLVESKKIDTNNKIKLFQDFLTSFSRLTEDDFKIIFKHYDPMNALPNLKETIELSEKIVNVLTGFYQTIITIDDTSTYYINKDSYTQIKVVFPQDFFGKITKVRNVKLYREQLILIAISNLLNNKVYPEDSTNVIYSQTTHMLSIHSLSERLQLEHYVMPNRKEFIHFMNDVFSKEEPKHVRPYIKQWIDTNDEYQTYQLFQQQRLATNFLNENSPYRGLLLYHGLGSGKSGASIAISEGYKNKNVIIMLPASLKTNYEMEITKFADISYKHKYNWCYVPLDIKWGQLPTQKRNELNNTELIKIIHEKGIPYELLNYKEDLNDKNVKKYKSLLKSMNTPNLHTVIRKKKYTKSINVNGKSTNKSYTYGVWLIDINSQEPPNFDSLSKQDQLEIMDTIQKMLQYRFKFISYNNRQGLFSRGANGIFELYSEELFNKIQKEALGSTKKFRELNTKSKTQILNYIYNPINNIPNPFDNKIVIVDEIHNLISEMSGNGFNGPQLYEMLMRANNLKLIGLSGTPVINSPMELFILFNLIRGPAYSFKMKVFDKSGIQIKKSDKLLKKLFHSIPEIDRILYNNDNTFTITFLPKNFVKVYENNKWNGKIIKQNSQLNDYIEQKTQEKDYTSKESFLSYLSRQNNAILDYIIEILFNSGYEVNKREVVPEIHTSFKDSIMNTMSVHKQNILADEFYLLRKKSYKQIKEDKDFLRSTYIDPNTNSVLEPYSFMTRIIGLVSYFCETTQKVPSITYQYQNYKKEYKNINLFPIVRKQNPIKIPMSLYQLIHYLNLRKKEIELEKASRNTKKDKDTLLGGNKSFQLFKVYTRQTGIFTFPSNIERPRVSTILNKRKDDLFVEKREIILEKKSNVQVEKKTDNLDFIEEEEQDKLENILLPVDTEVLSPAAIVYQQNILKALNLLKKENLRPSYLVEKRDSNTFYLDDLSTKYVELLKNVNNSCGLVFCYSQYRKIEGVELFIRILKNDGYHVFNPLVNLDNEDIHNKPINIGDKCIVFIGENITVTTNCTGINKEYYEFKNISDDLFNQMGVYLADWKTETEFEKQIKRKIIQHCKNSTKKTKFREYIRSLSSYQFQKKDIYIARLGVWSGTEDQELRKKVQFKFNEKYNMYGKNLKILLTTSAGAEGISLKNVREVHITEPYWNRVRIDQVIGRARRVGSHLELPPEQQNVSVFEYISTFPKELPEKSFEQFKSWLSYKHTNKENEIVLKKQTVSKQHIAKQYELFKTLYKKILKNDNNLTTDEDLYRIGVLKFTVNDSFLQLVKNSAIDCSINYQVNKEAGIIQQGVNYNDIYCFPSGEMEKTDYEIENIKRIPHENDKYNFQLDIVQEEFVKTRQKKYKKQTVTKAKTYTLPAKIYVLNKPAGADIQKFSMLNGKFRVVKLDSKYLLNFYRYFGIDPIYDTYKGDDILKDLENNIIGEYLEKTQKVTDAKKIKITADEIMVLYNLKLEKYLEKCWSYLLEKGLVSGSFSISENTFILFSKIFSNNEVPFVFTYKNNLYNIFDFKNIDISKNDSILTQYLTNEAIKLKLIYVKNIINKNKPTSKKVINLRKQRRKRGQIS